MLTTTIPLFQRLAQEVFLAILSFSDVYTVLSVSQANRHLRRAPSSKPRGPLSTLSEYTTIQLIDQVKTLVVGPRTWMVSADSNPQTSKEVTIPLGEPLRRPLATQLINGGRHIIIAAFPYSVLEIWDDDMLIVATQSRDSSCSEILHIDIQKWTITETLKIPLPPGRSAILRQNAAVGHCVVFDLTTEILLVNWRNRTYALLNGLQPGRSHIVGLIPGHIMILQVTYYGSSPVIHIPPSRLLLYETAIL
ncbi:hypothetical protein B0H13DRAFT_2668996 [Mycena leptocephala]|nr:hypothetical protein B0H13DRAFT_2668996 [Mycena leptocephala]